MVTVFQLILQKRRSVACLIAELRQETSGEAPRDAEGSGLGSHSRDVFRRDAYLCA